MSEAAAALEVDTVQVHLQKISQTKPGKQYFFFFIETLLTFMQGRTQDLNQVGLVISAKEKVYYLRNSLFMVSWFYKCMV